MPLSPLLLCAHDLLSDWAKTRGLPCSQKLEALAGMVQPPGAWLSMSQSP